MDNICEFIADNINDRCNESYGYSLLNQCNFHSIDLISNDISLLLDIDNITCYYHNYGVQRATIISFIYKGRKCNIYEHFRKKKNYIGVWMERI